MDGNGAIIIQLQAELDCETENGTMCGRFTLTLRAEEVRQVLGDGEWQPRYNIAPTQQVAALLNEERAVVRWLRWGLVPPWTKDPAGLPLLINARAETAAEKPAFRRAFAQQRCLILADGFYEWKKQTGGRRQPYWFCRAAGGLFAFAGLWETWRTAQGAELHTAAILTCAANDCVAPVHERMPVMLDFPAAWAWLDAADPALLLPYPAQAMRAVAVGSQVNNPRYDSADCLAPLEN